MGAASVVSVVTSFFALGGDSLKAGKLVAAMRKTLSVQLSVADLFTSPTIEAMAHKILILKTMGSPGMNSINRSKSTKSPKKKKTGLGQKKDISYAILHPDEEVGFFDDDAEDNTTNKYTHPDYISPFSNTSLGCLFIQALPLVIVYPIRRIIIWFLIAAPWVWLMGRGIGRFNALVIAMLVMRASLAVFAPLAGIVLKWVLIGRYQPGRYPLWGSM